jgi:Zn-dependent protease
MFISNLLLNPISFVAFLFALVLAITVHEYAHAWMAFKSGDPTAKVEGRLSLNPLVHLDPLGTLFLFFAGFGWGKPVPINTRNLRHRSDELKVAFAGIVANIILALLFALPVRFALLSGHTIESSTVTTVLNLIVEMNLILAAFNLLPIFPLDGSHLVEYFLREPARSTYQYIGPYVLLAILVYDRLTQSSILLSIMEPILRFLSLIVKGTMSSSL